MCIIIIYTIFLVLLLLLLVVVLVCIHTHIQKEEKCLRLKGSLESVKRIKHLDLEKSRKIVKCFIYCKAFFINCVICFCCYYYHFINLFFICTNFKFRSERRKVAKRKAIEKIASSINCHLFPSNRHTCTTFLSYEDNVFAADTQHLRHNAARDIKSNGRMKGVGGVLR